MPELARGTRTNGAAAKMATAKDGALNEDGGAAAAGVAPAVISADRDAAVQRRRTTGGGGGGGQKLEKRQVHSSPREDGAVKERKDKDREGTKKRRKVNHACIYCRRSHMTCDLDRPCNRCIKRNIGHLCHDEPREGIKRSKSTSEVPLSDGDHGGAKDRYSPERSMSHVDDVGIGNQGSDIAMSELSHVRTNSSNGPTLVQPTPVTASHIPAIAGHNAMLGFNHWANSNHINNFQDMHNFHSSLMFNTSEVSAEYNMLNDFLNNSLLDDSALYANDEMHSMFPDQNMPNAMGAGGATAFQQGQQVSNNQMLPPSQNAAGNAISRPTSGFPLLDKNREMYYLTAADPAGNESAEERMNKLLKAKHDAGMLRPFNYIKGYARLDTYMRSNFQPGSRQKILRQLDRFRPKFRERTQSLTDLELVVVEMWFERTLMEYDRVFASMAIPACCWRRTGEIFRGNREMAELIHVPTEKLREGQVSIHDIMVENSLVSYWEKFGAIAFDHSQKAILTSCSLKNPDATSKDKTLQCCFSFTIKRDMYNIPTIIVGNFLPIKD